MNIKLITTFLDLLESRNFNRTADRLNITQSSISGRIRALEKEVGAKLFERGRSGATPTAAGVRFESHARLLLATWDQARRDTGGSLNRNRHRLLRLSGQFSLMQPILVDWVTRIRTEEKNIAVEITADYSLQIIKNLSLGAIDIGLLYSPQYLPDLDIDEVGEDQFIMVSTESKHLQHIPKDTYINTDYTSHFSQRHQILLPELSTSPLSVSFEGLAVDFLNLTGGSAYIPMRLVNKLKGVISNLHVVKDAPKILQPIFTVVHIRRRHDADVIKARAVLQETLLASSKGVSNTLNPVKVGS